MENATRITFFPVLYTLSTAQLNFTLMILLINQMYLELQKTHRIFHAGHCVRSVQIQRSFGLNFHAGHCVRSVQIQRSFGLNFPVLGQFLRSAPQTNRTSNYGKRI